MTPFVPATHAFPLSRSARQKYEFLAPTFSDFALARRLADDLNATRDLKNQPELTVKAGRVAAAALLDEIFAFLIARYEAEVAPDALESGVQKLDATLQPRKVAAFESALTTHFAPPHALETRTQRVESALRLQLANLNPALTLFREVCDDAPLENTVYERVFPTLDAHFGTLPGFGPDKLPLLQLLLEPIRRHPDSLEDQVRFVLTEWAEMVEPLLTRLLTHLDLIREEEKPVFFGPGPAIVPDYGRAVGADEYEAFTADRDWMPRVVLIAKQTYVWLDQLSKKYKKHIFRLDQVPDEELDEMARRGLTGLWLIGVWQRSNASQTIKHMTGNPDAIASAYSLYSYDIAWEIGGREALEDLRNRAAARGIRMASDMVPNHMAIDSKWLVEHPDWFVSLDYPPFPHANFVGPDLCEDPNVGVFLEEGYYSKTDASVVFKRVDYNSGQELFVYHGNDGTNMPWNDTAQLNYLLPQVREAAMQTILEVARQFPIIRFDAAMTLAKRHYHRLWFPAPGSGGDIPSRAGRGLSPDEFDRAFPQEFWREVVDRIAVEAPDTLLLAEAFWLMEGYFVRTLGMHRVYNSAFMNMLRDEDNANYRLVLKNTLEFDLDILGRFVNFMNNPDEETAKEQFGSSDKYFGVCTLLATLPGLPMFGHGQIEGYGEKYGMEYPRAYWNEAPDAGFIKHHENVIFPLLKRRSLFAGANNFRLYDFWNEGAVNEDVYVYSNREGENAALVVYNNRYAPASGWISLSCAFARKNGSDKELVQTRLAEELRLTYGQNRWAIFRDASANLEFLRASDELCDRGLHVECKPYGYHVFLDWREESEESGLLARLAEKLGGRGVPSVARAKKELVLEKLLDPWKALCEIEVWEQAFEGQTAELETRAQAFARIALELSESAPDKDAANKSELFAAQVVAWAPPVEEDSDAPVSEFDEETDTDREADEVELNEVEANAERAELLAYGILRALGELLDEVQPGFAARTKLTDWLLDDTLESTLHHFGVRADAMDDIALWLAHATDAPRDAFALLSALLEDETARERLGVNTFNRVIWFRGDAVPELLETLRVGAALSGLDLPLQNLAESAEKSQFRVVSWMENVRRERTANSTSSSTSSATTISHGESNGASDLQPVGELAPRL